MKTINKIIQTIIYVASDIYLIFKNNPILFLIKLTFIIIMNVVFKKYVFLYAKFWAKLVYLCNL